MSTPVLFQRPSPQFALIVDRGDTVIVVGPFHSEISADGYRVRQEPSGQVVRFYEARNA